MKIGVRNRVLARFCSSQLGLAEEFVPIVAEVVDDGSVKRERDSDGYGNKRGEDMCLAFKGIQMFRKTKKNRSKEW